MPEFPVGTAMIISKTPYRLSFFGGGTDYPVWYRENGGAVINATIDKYCWLFVRYLPPFFEHKHRIVYSMIELPNKIDEIHHPSVRECLRFMNLERGVEIHHEGDLPARSGIGSSSAFTVGLLNALHALKGENIEKIDLALEAIHVEQDLIKEQVGSQDQIACSVGGLNLIEFGKQGKPKVKPITILESKVRVLESSLMLVFTGFPHNASDVAGSYEFEERKSELNELQQLTARAYAVLCKQDISEIGKLLHEGWLLKRRLSSQISTPYIEYVYSTALSAGAIGGKLLGAGGGGFMLLFCEPDRQENIREALKGLLFVPFKFGNSGSTIIVNSGGE